MEHRGAVTMSLRPKKQRAKTKESKKMKKHEQTSSRPKVHGLRTCLRCKGICHEDSLRRKGRGFGGRAHYFCSYGCMKLYNELKYYSDYRRICERQDKMDEYRAKMEEMAQKNLKRYEYVDCITE